MAGAVRIIEKQSVLLCDRLELDRRSSRAVLSRAVSGLRGECLIINLPGSPKAVKECLEAILPAIPHGVEIIKGEVTEHTTGMP